MHDLHGFFLEVLRLALWLVILCAVLLPIERAFALRPTALVRKGTWVDLGHYFLNSLAVTFAVGLSMAVAAAAARHALPQAVHDTVAAMPVWARLMAAFLVGETGFYWGTGCRTNGPCSGASMQSTTARSTWISSSTPGPTRSISLSSACSASYPCASSA
jgi:hypothetical protein